MGALRSKPLAPKPRAVIDVGRKATKPTAGTAKMLFFGPLDVLGLQDDVVLVNNEPNARNVQTLSTTVAAPMGTTHVYCALNRWVLSYGEITVKSNGSAVATVDDDQHFALAYVNTSASVNTGISPPTVTVKMVAMVSNISLAPRYGWDVRVSLLFLGRRPAKRNT